MANKKGFQKEFRLSKADIGGPLPKKEQVEQSESGISSMMLRFVTIQKTENGYGLTVSGDNPVYVQSVKENGAAHVAGVREGDRIIKVNGVNVTESNHIEVVKLIKGEKHVALTLISAQNASEEPIVNIPDKSTISARPQSSLVKDSTFHDEKIHTIKKMLNQEKREVERIKENYAKNPDRKLLDSLANAQKLLQDLEKQLWKAENSNAPMDIIQRVPLPDTFGVSSCDDFQLHERDHLQSKLPIQKSESNSLAKPILNFEDDFGDESECPHDHGPFKDFQLLKTKPAHTAVFLNYVFRSQDPSYLLFVLLTDISRHLSTIKDLYKLSDVLVKNFLIETAPLKVQIAEGIITSIVESLHARSLSEESLRSIFDPVSQHCLNVVKDQLRQFCSKREQGLSNCFGEEKAVGSSDHSQELKIAEEIIQSLLQDLTQLQYSSEEVEVQKLNAKIDALERLLTFWNGKKKSRIGLRISSMLRPSRPTGQVRPKSSASIESILEEHTRPKSGPVKFFSKKQKSTRDSIASTAPISSSTAILYPTSVQDAPEGIISSVRSPDSVISSLDWDESRNIVAKETRSDKLTKCNSEVEIDDTESKGESEFDVPSLTQEEKLAVLYGKYPELDIAPESPWSVSAPRHIIKHLDKKECKRQEVINELLQTEQHHFRDLQILSLLFYPKMKEEGGLSLEELNIIFPNLNEILEMHQKLKNDLMTLKNKDGYVIKEIGPVLEKMFLGDAGDKFRNACATYCGNQSAALIFIKERCKKDQRFNSLIQTMERHPICRRLQLKDFIPVEFQRLTKYPLLLDNLIKNSRKNEEHLLLIIQKKAKMILQHVDKAIKDAEDFQKVVEIQKNLDSSALAKANHPIAQEYKNINLTDRKLIHQGPLTWRITLNEKRKSVRLHCVLFEDIMVLLQRQEEKYILKCHTSTAPNMKDTVQPPILKLSKVFVRSVATDKRAFYVLSASEFGPQIYELVTSTSHEMQEWLNLVSSAIDIAKLKAPSLPPNTPNPETGNQEFPGSGESRNTSVNSKGNNQRRDKEEDFLTQLHTYHDTIQTTLARKYQLLASHANMNPEDFNNMLDLTMEDSFRDSNSLVLHLLVLSNKLASIMNEVLSPDTEFLIPSSPYLLQPVPHSESQLMHPITAQFERNEAVEQHIDAPISIDTNDTGFDPMGGLNVDSLNGRSVFKILDENSPIDITTASDYETASESPSPVSDMNNSGDTKNEKLNSEISAEDISETSFPLSIAEVNESGIAADKSTDKTTSSSDYGLTGELVSLMPPKDSDTLLLDFEEEVNTPDPIQLLSPSSKVQNKECLYGRINPINVTKMLEIQRSIHFQLIRLQESLKTQDSNPDQASEQGTLLKCPYPPIVQFGPKMMKDDDFPAHQEKSVEVENVFEP